MLAQNFREYFLIEWVEFTPFEFGTAKYGVFGKIEDFGGKYYKGRLVKKYAESPLHYLQGGLNERGGIRVPRWGRGLVLAVGKRVREWDPQLSLLNLQTIIRIIGVFYVFCLFPLGIWGSAFSVILDTLNHEDHAHKTETERQTDMGRYRVILKFLSLTPSPVASVKIVHLLRILWTIERKFFRSAGVQKLTSKH